MNHANPHPATSTPRVVIAQSGLKADRPIDLVIVLAAVEQNGLALKFVADHLKADREIVLASINQYGPALR